MLARLHVQISPGVYVPESLTYNPIEYRIDGPEGLRVTEYLPVRSTRTPSTAGSIRINDQQAIYVDTLRFDFHKSSFDRSGAVTIDPSPETLTEVVNYYLLRLRHVAKAGAIRPLNFPFPYWSLQYLNDDGSSLLEEEGKLPFRAGGEARISYIAISKEIWEGMLMPAEYRPQPWEGILLDAQVELPSIGPSLVLAATALEVFASHTLDNLAKDKGVSESLWQWINNRNNLDQNPSVSEQLDVLLKELTGHSLKEDGDLWRVHKNLREARNSFVHEGVPRVGSDVVKEADARTLVAGASKIITRVREWLPENLRWKEFDYKMKLQVELPIG